MANCPKCNRHLRLIDWKQTCPECGANIFVYNLQERLMAQADEAEVEHYYFQQKVDRVKGAFIGSKLAVARIFTSILPIGPLFLPLINAELSAPFEEFAGNISAIEIYKNSDKLGVITQLLSSGRANLFFAISFACLILSLLFTILHFGLNTLACSPKGKPRNIVMDILTLVFSVAPVVLFVSMGDGGCVKGTVMYGAWLYILLQVVNAAVDIATLIKGIEIKHEQCYVGAIPIEEYFEMQKNGATHDEIRAEQYKRLQARYDEKKEKLKEEEEAERLKKEAEKSHG